MIHTRARMADGTIQTDLPTEDLHNLLDDKECLVWIDFESPSADEIGLIGGIPQWEHLTIEDLTKQGQRGKLEHFDRHVLRVMHALSYDGDPSKLDTPEVDFVIGPNYVATVHYVHLPHITEARDPDSHGSHPRGRAGLLAVRAQ